MFMHNFMHKPENSATRWLPLLPPTLRLQLSGRCFTTTTTPAGHPRDSEWVSAIAPTCPRRSPILSALGPCSAFLPAHPCLLLLSWPPGSERKAKVLVPPAGYNIQNILNITFFSAGEPRLENLEEEQKYMQRKAFIINEHLLKKNKGMNGPLWNCSNDSLGMRVYFVFLPTVPVVKHLFLETIKSHSLETFLISSYFVRSGFMVNGAYGQIKVSPSFVHFIEFQLFPTLNLVMRRILWILLFVWSLGPMLDQFCDWDWI